MNYYRYADCGVGGVTHERRRRRRVLIRTQVREFPFFRELRRL